MNISPEEFKNKLLNNEPLPFIKTWTNPNLNVFVLEGRYAPQSKQGEVYKYISCG